VAAFCWEVRQLVVDLHLLCKQGQRNKRVGPEPTRYETGTWPVTDEVAEEAIGGRVYLHAARAEEAYYGGTIQAWRAAADDPKRKSFEYVVDGPFRIRCPEKWGQEKAIVRR